MIPAFLIPSIVGPPNWEIETHVFLLCIQTLEDCVQFQRIEAYINYRSTGRQVPCKPPIMLSLTLAALVGENAFRSARKATKELKLSIYRHVGMAIKGTSYAPCDNKYL